MRKGSEFLEAFGFFCFDLLKHIRRGIIFLKIGAYLA